MKYIFLVLIVFTLVFSACKKDPQPVPAPVSAPTPVPQSTVQPVPDSTLPLPGKVRLEFYNQVDGAPLIFGTKYMNANGDTFSLKKLVYYISNIQFLKHDTVVSEKESYHLIDHAVATRTTFIISPLEAGTYTSVKLMIGVDSTRNCSGIQSGDLDPAKGMFWTWNSGYIFLKAEGSSLSSPQNGGFIFHIGGFSGVNKAQRQLHLSLPTALLITEKTSPVIKVAVNINELFKTPHLIDFKTQNYMMTPGPQVKPFADNYEDMIGIESVQN